ncbi:unnamed protein product [Paramecium octaurelia]|uniref:Uncharacterized protein n=1 Tax=Paramecium octaurelia TaxID=43137 RepID=A0A8S1VKS2_PAROT|nr:unnamed protein product [Paramecium octaurelia]
MSIVYKQLQTIYSKKWRIDCQVISIDQNNLIVALGSNRIIHLFQYYKSKLKEVQTLLGHIDDITTLAFTQKRSQLISGSKDKQIIVWSLQLLKQPRIIQKLREHSEQINSLLLNRKEELIISSCNKIVFWKQLLNESGNQQQWVCVYQYASEKQIFGLSLNEDEDQVVGCCEDQTIIVMKQENQNYWTIKQKIIIDEWGYRICFVGKNTFVFQPILEYDLVCLGAKFLHIYSYNQLQNKFLKSGQIQVKGDCQACFQYFPTVYNSRKRMLIHKNGCHLNLIRVQEKTTQIKEEDLELYFKLVEIMNFGNSEGFGNIIGTLSNDGEILIIWDQNAKEITINMIIME